MAKHKSKENLSDAALVSQYRITEDLTYLGVLFQRHIPMVMGVAMKYLKNEQAADDAVMDIFEVVLKDLKRFEVKYFKSWLYMVTKNHCLMRLNSERKEQQQRIIYMQGQREFMESDLVIHLSSGDERSVRIEKLKTCLEQLREEQKKCVELFYLAEKCYKEVQEITGYEYKKVKSYIQNGKRQLKNCMEENGGRQD